VAGGNEQPAEPAQDVGMPVQCDRGSGQQLGILGSVGHGTERSRTTMRQPAAAEESDNQGGVGRRCGSLRPLRSPLIVEP
jgi:hypothetical protein